MWADEQLIILAILLYDPVLAKAFAKAASAFVGWMYVSVIFRGILFLLLVVSRETTHLTREMQEEMYIH